MDPKNQTQIDLIDTNPIVPDDLTVQIIPIKKSKVSPQVPQFPNEIWLKVIGYMKIRDVFGSFALSCKHFNNLTKDLRAIKLKRIETWEDFRKVLEIAKRLKNLLEFKIDEFYDNHVNRVAVDYLMNFYFTNPKLKVMKIGDWKMGHR